MGRSGLGDCMNWIFTQQQLLDSPSKRDGISFEREWRDRTIGTSIIFRVGAHTRAPIHSLHVAMIFYQRFYMRRSLKGHNFKEVALASLYLALKLYDVHIKLKDLISLYAKVQGIDITKEFVSLVPAYSRKN